MGSKLCVPICTFVQKFPPNVIFRGKSRFFYIDRLMMSKNTFWPNIKCIDFWESYTIFIFYGFTRTLTRIYKNLSKYLLRKSCKFWGGVVSAILWLIWCIYKSKIFEAFETYFWCLPLNVRNSIGLNALHKVAFKSINFNKRFLFCNFC